MFMNHLINAAREDLFLRVGGLVCDPTEQSPDEFVTWRYSKLKVGDEVRVTVIETESISKPKERKPRNPAEDLRQSKQYVRTMAKKFGWKIVSRPAGRTGKSRVQEPGRGSYIR
jgi:hypothetical protein